MVQLNEAREQELEVARQLDACLALEKPNSFFLFAGAGSGKTKSLVGALLNFRDKYGEELRKSGKQVAVVTYTNAACDEIRHRLEFNSGFHVSTIHSFVWTFLDGHNVDIRAWLKSDLEADIQELEDKEVRGRGGKASEERQREIKYKRERLEILPSIKVFKYSPNGDNRERESLNHSQVIRMGADFLRSKVLLQKVVINRYPAILIDESQDTTRELIEALFSLEEKYQGKFCLGLFGDTMQRIYADGKKDLGENLPAWWKRPAKSINYRCPKRVVELINLIRAGQDGQRQAAIDGAPEGTVRLFIARSSTDRKLEIEGRAREAMADATKDRLWNFLEEVKTLTLEHHMAARRLGFFGVFEPLYRIESIRTSLLDGTLSGLRLFWNLASPLAMAQLDENKHKVAVIVRENSPLLSPCRLMGAAQKQRHVLAEANEAVRQLADLWRKDGDPSCGKVLSVIRSTGLFEIPDALKAIEVAGNSSESEEKVDPEVEKDPNVAWAKVLSTPISQVDRYASYVEGRAAFDTHQGVKGLQFPRVLVVIDDEEAKGFLFSYEKMFGTKPKTKADLENEQKGDETSLDRTARLFYVTCSRAQEGLAVVAYTTDPGALRSLVQARGWFRNDEIMMLE